MFFSVINLKGMFDAIFVSLVFLRWINYPWSLSYSVFFPVPFFLIGSCLCLSNFPFDKTLSFSVILRQANGPNELLIRRGDPTLRCLLLREFKIREKCTNLAGKLDFKYKTDRRSYLRNYSREVKLVKFFSKFLRLFTTKYYFKKCSKKDRSPYLQ